MALQWMGLRPGVVPEVQQIKVVDNPLVHDDPDPTKAWMLLKYELHIQHGYCHEVWGRVDKSSLTEMLPPPVVPVPNMPTQRRKKLKKKEAAGKEDHPKKKLPAKKTLGWPNKTQQPNEASSSGCGLV